MVVNTAPTKLSTRPAPAICRILTHPLLNTMALGGVATGNMKAKEAENVAGTISKRG